MSFSKTEIYNLALSALLVSRQVENVDTDKTTNEVRVLNTHWEVAFRSALTEMDLDSLSEPIPLELISKLDNVDIPWDYVYEYPKKCAFLRRIRSGAQIDTSRTHISKRTGLYEGVKAIYTNENKAVGECITDDIPLEALSPMAAMAIAHNLAFMSAPLIVGKGAKSLRDQILQAYLIYKESAQEADRLENVNFDDPWDRSEWVAARLE